MKNRYLISIVCLLFCFSCSDDDSVEVAQLTSDQQLAIDYFTEIALGFEFGTATEVTRKWESDILITVAGDPTAELLNELDLVISELNSLIAASELEISVTTDASLANFTVFMGSGEAYGEFLPVAAPFVDSNFGLFFVSFNQNEVLTEASMYVDTFRPTELKQRHLLREELTQALGLAQDSGRFLDSIFQISFEGCATSYSNLDEVLIQLLYDPRVDTNLNEAEVRVILEEIIAEFI